MNNTHQLGELQLAIMQVLWTQGECTVAEVHRILEPRRGLALTTIATMLSKMEKKGVVAHRTRGRQFIYRSAVEEDDVQRSMVSELTNRLFGGSVSALVNHLLSDQAIDPGELKELKALIASREKQGKNHA
ncbi:MAG: BlaI/MecI/CopY family transcriptional regulator [Planctomycetales bacterium]